MVNMYAKFDEEAHNSLVSIVLTFYITRLSSLILNRRQLCLKKYDIYAYKHYLSTVSTKSW